MALPLRPLEASDLADVNALCRSVGWPERSIAGWRWLLDDPGLRETGAPAGWVIDGPDGRVGAHLGNMVRRFHLDGRILHAAAGHTIIVGPQARGSARRLIGELRDQPGVFAAYVLNANNRSAPLYQSMGLDHWPSTHDVKLSWRIDPVVQGAARLLRGVLEHAPALIPERHEWLLNRRLDRALAVALPPGVERLAWPGPDRGPGSKMEAAVESGPGRDHVQTGLTLADDGPMAAFWDALSREGRLLSDRSPAEIRYRLGDPDSPRPPLLLAFRRAGRVTGWSAAALSKMSLIDAPVLEVLDLEALEAEAEAIPALMTALHRAARAMGAAKLRLPMVSPALLARLGPWADRARREGGWGHAHVHFTPGGPAPDLWSPTPFDADYAACLRYPPVRRRERRRAQPASLCGETPAWSG